MNTRQQRLLGSILLNLILIPGASAGNTQLGHALDQAQAAKVSYQSADTQQANAHTRAALAHVEILRREHKADKGLKTAETDLRDSLRNYNNQGMAKAAMALDRAIQNLERFRETE
jgi:hypothetical protein